MIYCNQCVTKDLCDVIGCSISLTNIMSAGLDGPSVPREIVKEPDMSDTKAPLAPSLSTAVASPAPPHIPPVPSVGSNSRMVSLPKSLELHIRFAIGGYIMQMPDGAMAVAVEPDMLGAMVADWAKQQPR
jgi:hypothetical protein